ncbi:MAG: hypothetical protein ACXU8S_12640 [Phenylobacterium sp.]
MDENLELLAILLGVGLAVGIGGAVVMSQSVRRYGVLGVFRRAFSGGADRNPYAG